MISYWVDYVSIRIKICSFWGSLADLAFDPLLSPLLPGVLLPYWRNQMEIPYRFSIFLHHSSHDWTLLHSRFTKVVTFER